MLQHISDGSDVTRGEGPLSRMWSRHQLSVASGMAEPRSWTIMTGSTGRLAEGRGERLTA